MMRRDDCFRALAARLPDDQVVVATYTAAFEWIAIRPGPLNYLSVGAMGLASSHALGLALGRPDRRILVLDGDGSLLMNLGSLATMAGAAPENLVHFVCENGSYEANGGHPTPAPPDLSFAGLARAAGYAAVHEFSDLAAFEDGIDAALAQKGPVFVELELVEGGPLDLDYAMMHGEAVRRAFKDAFRGS